MKKVRWDVVALASIVGASAASAALYERLPERVATHFDLHGNPNGWMPRTWAAAFMPVFALVLWAVVRFAPHVLPRSDKNRMSPDVVAFVAALTAMFLATLHVVILRVAIAPPTTSVTTLTLVLAGLLFVAIGLVLPRVKRNPLIGIRTAWTLRSDENWARTQRVGGATMVAAGLVAAVAAGLGGAGGAIAAIGAMILAGVVPVVYSLVLARRAG